MYRDPRYMNPLIARVDEVLFESQNEATCPVKACRGQCVAVTLYPATLEAEADCEVPFPKCHSLPSCEPLAPRTSICIRPLDTQKVGTGSLIVLERKIGRCGWVEVCRWDFSLQPMVNGVPQFANDMMAGPGGPVRLRVVRYDGQPVYAKLEVVRCKPMHIQHLSCGTPAEVAA